MGFKPDRAYAGFMRKAPVVRFVNRLQEMAWGQHKCVPAPRVLAVTRVGPGQDALRGMLNDLGWTVVFAGTPADAIARYCEDPFPVILYERELTACDWRLVVPLFAKLSPPPFVMLLSASSDWNLWDEVVRRGGCDILRMPPDRDALM